MAMSDIYLSNIDEQRGGSKPVMQICSLYILHRYCVKLAIFCILSALFTLSMFSCSDIPEPTSIFLSGSIDTQNNNWPTFIAITKTKEIKNIEDISTEAFVELIEADAPDKSFGIELSDKGILPGDGIIVFAFIDKDYRNGIPFPGEGDLVGLYYDKEDLTPTYHLSSGHNNNIHLNLNRMVHSVDAKITGSVNCPDSGDLALIAYAGEIISSDFRKFDPDYVIGYTKITKNSPSISFQIDIWPYLPCGLSLPIEQVYIFALLDIDQNDTLDTGDKIGYYKFNQEEWPAIKKVDQGVNKLDYTIDLPMEIKEQPSFTIQLKGSVTMPPSYISTLNPGPLYVFIADADVLDSDPDNPYPAIKYFERISPENTEIDFDLSSTGLKPGDDIYLFSLWDKDYKGQTPDITDGDFVGFYMDMNVMSPRLTLDIGPNEGINLTCNRVFASEPDTSISGSVTGDKTGNVLIFAYAGEITSSDFSKLDQDAILGFHSIVKEETKADFEMKLSYRPYDYRYPIENVYIAALLDAKQHEKEPNGVMDEGDMTGYLQGDNGLPTTIRVIEGQKNSADTPIELKTEVQHVATFDVSLEGFITLPGVYYETDTWPIFVAISHVNGFDSNDPVSSIKYFQKLEKGQDKFKFDLSQTGLGPGDEIMVYAFWDLDYKGELPLPTRNDMMGLLQNKNTFQFSIILREGLNTVDPESQWEFKLDRKIYEHNAQIKFSLTDGDLPAWLDDNGDGNKLDDGDQVFMMAVHKDGVDEYWIDQFSDGDINLELHEIFGLPDMDYIIGMTTISVGEDDDNGNYTMSILPMIYEEIPVIEPSSYTYFKIEDVYLFAILDHDKDGPELLEVMGYYSKPFDLSPMIHVPDSFDIQDYDVVDGTSVDGPVPVRFSNHSTVGVFHRVLVLILQMLEVLIDI